MDIYDLPFDQFFGRRVSLWVIQQSFQILNIFRFVI